MNTGNQIVQIPGNYTIYNIEYHLGWVKLSRLEDILVSPLVNLLMR